VRGFVIRIGGRFAPIPPPNPYIRQLIHADDDGKSIALLTRQIACRALRRPTPTTLPPSLPDAAQSHEMAINAPRLVCRRFARCHIAYGQCIRVIDVRAFAASRIASKAMVYSPNARPRVFVRYHNADVTHPTPLRHRNFFRYRNMSHNLRAAIDIVALRARSSSKRSVVRRLNASLPAPDPNEISKIRSPGLA
jgi:hypothetical protein